MLGLQKNKMDIIDKLSYPNSGDKLFIFDGIPKSLANIQVSREDWCIYSNGYKNVPTILYEYIKKSPAKKNFLIYPIVFSYRHYIELTLKNIIRNGYRLLQYKKTIPTHHEIHELWKECDKILKKIPDYTEDSEIKHDVVRNLIEEFKKYDSLSFAFRYPTDRKGNVSLPNLKNVNLDNFITVGHKLSNALDTLVNYLYVLLDQE